MRKSFGAGTFTIFGECSQKDVIDYYKWLKDEYDASGEYATVEEVGYLGYQGKGYWVLSDSVSTKRNNFIT